MNSSTKRDIDPTKNVLDLVGAAIQRIDDMADLRQQLVTEKIGRIAEIATLRASHQVALDAEESARLDSVRMIDQVAVQREAERASAGIDALATAAATTADVLRNAVTDSAQSLATQHDRMMSSVSERIAALEKSSYTGLGKEAVSDPQIAHLVKVVGDLVTAGSQRTGQKEGISTATGVLVVVATLILSATGLYMKAPANSPQAQPQIIYMPAPSGTMIPSPPTNAPATAPR